MELSKLFRMQQSLDGYIEKEHGLEEEDLLDKKLLAFLVEAGELANETRCFKFWSVKGPSEREVILEEFVDGVHFILSIGLECALEEKAYLMEDYEGAESAVEQFLTVYESAVQFKQTKNLTAYNELLNGYFALGRLLGFSLEEVEQAYKVKNDINYERQQKGY
ncbi:dUTP diphosphatase [Bacillus thermotolerans]|uniref:Dimeric dUTPase n=1 Tax=Bacillus thermotolerans TaxID=1221996 RepID=A0A0F5IDT0_BACTR|nr:dUTP diphosphatase [Bacillus thermotolerans]KKB34792.1 Dimeric dUTPase [Bacillus thermotolerans]KKB36683.1 Dimeric dUTPase [Bacillus thermotolerans]KKB43332.1 Dimeric dUTPase [Bacillus thermotolerans]